MTSTVTYLMQTTIITHLDAWNSLLTAVTTSTLVPTQSTLHRVELFFYNSKLNYGARLLKTLQNFPISFRIKTKVIK